MISGNRIVRICVLINVALIVGALLNDARTGHLVTGILIYGGTTLLVALAYLRKERK